MFDGEGDSTDSTSAHCEQETSANFFMGYPRNEPNDELKMRSYSFSNLMKFRNEKRNNPLTRQVISDFAEDSDNCSIVSDSGVSDVSQNTDASINSVVSTGFGLDNSSMRRNFSTSDVTMFKNLSHVKPNSDVKFEGMKSQQTLPNFLLWKWLSSQRQCSPVSHETGSSTATFKPESEITSSSTEKKLKSRLSMRDLNVVVPNGW